MSIPLPNTDLSAAIAGSTGSIDLTKVGVGAGGVSANPSMLNKPANMFLFNESGCTLTITFQQSGSGFKLPAGGWTITPLPPGEYLIKWSVDFLLTGAPISLLLCTYYAPGEPTPTNFALGNSPIGGAVQTSGGGTTADHLINVGNPATTSPIIEIAPAGAPNYTFLTDNQGNLFLGVWSGGVLTQIFKVISGAAANNDSVVIGDAQHLVHMLGAIVGDKYASAYQYFAGTPGTPGEVRYDTQGGLGTGNGIGFRALFAATDANSNGFYAQGQSGAANMKGLEAFSTVGMTGTNIGVNIEGPTWTTGLDTSNMSAGTAIKWPNGNISTAGVLSLIAGSISRIKFGFQAIASGGSTVTHGLGVTPTAIFIQNGSGTGGIVYTVTAPGATTFTVTPNPATATNVYWMALAP